jgi:hypothetical protein
MRGPSNFAVCMFGLICSIVVLCLTPVWLGFLGVAVVTLFLAADALVREFKTGHMDEPYRPSIPRPRSRLERRLRRVRRHDEHLRAESRGLAADDPDRVHIEGQLEQLRAVEEALLREQARARLRKLGKTTERIVSRELGG